MKIVVASCWKYRDAWKPFFGLLEKFWPTRPYPVELLTDRFDGNYEEINGALVTVADKDYGWCGNLSAYARAAAATEGSLMVMQEDFLLNAPVNEHLIEKGLQQLEERKAAMVRLYPCPGGDIPYGDKWYAEIPKGTRYRVSCQATIWNPYFLAGIAGQCATPADFEIRGSELSGDYMEPFLAFRRDVQPWPLSYICSAISRGKWEPDALEFCRQQGIEVDTSLRPVA